MVNQSKVSLIRRSGGYPGAIGRNPIAYPDAIALQPIASPEVMTAYQQMVAGFVFRHLPVAKTRQTGKTIGSYEMMRHDLRKLGVEIPPHPSTLTDES